MVVVGVDAIAEAAAADAGKFSKQRKLTSFLQAGALV